MNKRFTAYTRLMKYKWTKKLSLFYKGLYDKRKRIAYASILSFIILIVSYILSNWNFALTGESLSLRLIEAGKALFNRYILKKDYYENDSTLLSKFTFIDVENDNALIDSVYVDDVLAGNAAIPDREKLYEFLKCAEGTGYRYIIVDVDLSDDYSTLYNDSLFNLISKMPRVIVAGDFNNEHPINSRIKNKAYWVHYGVNFINSDMLKYPLIYNNRSSVPYKVYQDLNDSINQSVDKTQLNKVFGFLYFEGSYLSLKNIYPKMYLREDYKNKSEVFNQITSEPIYVKLGEDILTPMNEDPVYEKDYIIETYIEDKIIIIGTFVGDSDVHSTYCGSTHGAMIISNSIISLLNENHHISFWASIILYIFFYYISYFILYGNQTLKTNNKIKLITIVWTNYTISLLVVCSIIFILFSRVYDVLFTSTFLSLIDIPIRLIRKYKNKKYA